MEMQTVLAPLERVLSKYRRDVHQLGANAAHEALTSTEGHLGRPMPTGLRQFLSMHNGASLFRGSFRLRSAADLAYAAEGVDNVVLFADGPGETRWAYAVDEQGRVAFGRWEDERLEALHATFAGWFSATLGMVEARVLAPEDEASLRRQIDPHDPFQLTSMGRIALERGRPDEARTYLQEATTRDPDLVIAWQLLGDALSVSDRASARQAWLRAVRRTRFPMGWPGAGHVDPSVFKALARSYRDAEAWETELLRFLDEQVVDVRTEAEATVVVAAAHALVRSLVQRGARRVARDWLSGLVSRCHGFTRAFDPWTLVMALARLSVDLGHHDEAEALIRRIRREAPEAMEGPSLLMLARIAVTRQEPWAEELLDEAAAAGVDPSGQVELLLLRIERLVRGDRVQDAEPLLEEAARMAKRQGLPKLQAAVCMADGDIARMLQEPTRSRAAYARAHALVGERDAEVRYRVELRLGDLALLEQDAASAERHWSAAAQGFGQYELPVREAWAMARLLRICLHDPKRATPLLKAARDRFVAADLAAGVGVLDAITQQPGASLDWHLDRSATHARARHDAQKPRAPWSRSDACRPERRLGAHRLSVAACGPAMVQALARELEACASAVSAGRGRAKDPPVLRFVAACDLLSGHRSFEAAEVLLGHLMQRSVDGVAFRALQGAIARSPNAALVDGLLRAIESPQALPGPSVSAAAELLGMRREPAALQPLCALASPGNRPSARKAALSALGRIGNRHVTEVIASALTEPSLAEVAALALLMLGDRRGVDFHGRALMEERRDLSGHPGEIVGRYGGPEHLLLLQNAAMGTDERALGALQGLGLLGDPRGVPTLLDSLNSREKEVVEVAAGALTILTGHSEQVGEHGWRNRWFAWWEGHEDRYPEGVRHRDGKVFDLGLLIERMGHDDAYTRRTAYDELVIGSGANLPFDADGPWRVQCAHLRAWKRWWATARHRYVAGRWYHDGKQIH